MSQVLQPEVKTYKRRGLVDRGNLKKIINGVKTKMKREEDPYKKRMWAEIGLELNLLLLQLD